MTSMNKVEAKTDLNAEGSNKASCGMHASSSTQRQDEIHLLSMSNFESVGSSMFEANLMWQAAYFGQVEFLRYLLKLKVKTDEPVCPWNTDVVETGFAHM
eukprot:3879835-Amphidinium_carterae.1